MAHIPAPTQHNNTKQPFLPQTQRQRPRNQNAAIQTVRSSILQAASTRAAAHLNPNQPILQPQHLHLHNLTPTHMTTTQPTLQPQHTNLQNMTTTQTIATQNQPTLQPQHMNYQPTQHLSCATCICNGTSTQYTPLTV